MSAMDKCVICGDFFLNYNDGIVVRRGWKTIREASKEKGDNIYFKWSNHEEGRVHKQCRVDYTRRTSIEACKRKSTGDFTTFYIPNVHIHQL